MKPAPKYQHPEYSACTWSGRGARPQWVRSHVLNGGRLDDLLIEKVTVTQTDTINQEQPKKRGRPTTGNAKSAAERKAEQRRRVDDLIANGGPADLYDWIESASAVQLCEVLPRLIQKSPIHAMYAASQLRHIAEARTDRGPAYESGQDDGPERDAHPFY